MQEQPQTVLFLHIPKAAGTTLTQILDRQYSTQEILPSYKNSKPRFDKLSSLSTPEKYQIKLIRGHFPFGVHEMLPQHSTYITMLRDPIKRVISNYYFAKKTPSHRLYETINQEGMSLEEYITSEINPQLNNGQVRLISGNTDVAYGKCTNEILEKAKHNLKTYFSVVGTVENFDRTLIALREILGYKNICYTKANTNQSNKSNHIDNKLINLIKNYNILDIELYNYAIELQEEIFNHVRVDNKLVKFQRINMLYSWYEYFRTYLNSTLNVSRKALKKMQLSQ